ncbi:MAG: adenosylhomocysteinase [Acidimicrobiia bacterium]
MTNSEQSVAQGRIDWTRRHMPALVAAMHEFAASRPFDGLTVGFRIHLEPKTAILIETLLAGGARVVALGNEGTTQFGTVAVVSEWGCEVVERPGDGPEEAQAHVRQIAALQPDLILDNGAELITACLSNTVLPRGATEETTSGAFRLREDFAGQVGFPVIVINDSPLKAIVENKHAVGESVVETIVHTTNISFHKKRVVVFGYGWCGRGVAMYSRSRGADVTIVEIDPVKSLEAAMDGFDVRHAENACETAEVVITATGRPAVVPYELIETMPDGVLLANADHVGNEIAVEQLPPPGDGGELMPSLTRHKLSDERSVFVLAGGQMVNLAVPGSMGNSIESMDLGFTLQARSMAALIDPSFQLDNGPQPVPAEINNRIATAILENMGQLTAAAGN